MYHHHVMRWAHVKGTFLENVLELNAWEKNITCKQKCVFWYKKTSRKSVVVVQERSFIFSIIFGSRILFAIYCDWLWIFYLFLSAIILFLIINYSSLRIGLIVKGLSASGSPHNFYTTWYCLKCIYGLLDLFHSDKTIFVSPISSYVTRLDLC